MDGRRTFDEALVGRELPADAELPSVHEQLIVFARELGELYRKERARARELERVLSELREAYLATMKSLAMVVEAKDEATRGHLDRTQAYGLALARAVDPELATEELGFGFFLHDIGKVGVPEHVLRKPGPLTAQEWEIMRTHPVLGAQIVAPIAFLGGAERLVRHHHERFDGTGYPDGLRAEEIPLAARVFAVADAFDAMTSDRPYRAAMPLERALEEIVDGAGSQFDPEVVRVFVDLVEDGSLEVVAGRPSAGNGHAPGGARAEGDPGARAEATPRPAGA
jgi:ribonuclease P protein subunit RPR2